MSITYNIVNGDTLSLVSKKVFGTGIHGSHIANANPGLGTALVPGTSIVIPPLPNYPGDLPRILGISGDNNVQIFINGFRFEFWTNISIKRSLDSIDVITFSAPFDPAAPGYSNTFEPFTYKDLRVSVNGLPLLTGRIIANHPNATPTNNTIEVSGYSLPGVLSDCTAPASSFPLEWNNITVIDIAKAVSKPFGLSIIAPIDSGKTFDKEAMQPTDKVYDFLAGLARQRNMVISNTEDGEVLFWKSNDAVNPVAELELWKQPVTEIEPNFNEQEYYSHITGISFAATGVPGSQYTDKNPYLPGTIRPFTFGATDTDNIDIKTAVNAKTSRMFANMLSYRVTVNTWRDKGGQLWKPNTTVQVFAPEVFILRKYNFILRSVEFNRDKNSEWAILELVPPGSFDGTLPERLPWHL